MSNTSVDSIKEYFTFHSIKPSIQRVKIYQYLINNKSHPTVDEIYNSLSSELITLSKTTVYNTLHLFVENGIAVPIHVEGNEIRYDADIVNHAHFKCNNCDRVFDVSIDITSDNFKELKDYTISDFQLFMTGICRYCNKTSI